MILFKKEIKKISVFLLMASFFIAGFALANNGFTTPLNFNTITEFLTGIINAVITILFPIIVLMFVYSGFLFLKAQGNPGEIAKARTALMWSFIGAMVVLGAWALAHAVEAILKAL